MYSYEDRLRAVQLYINLGKRAGLTIRQLGYPTKNALGQYTGTSAPVRPIGSGSPTSQSSRFPLVRFTYPR